MIARGSDCKRFKKGAMHHQLGRRGAFTLVEIMIVVAIIGLLAAIAIPNFVRSRDQSQVNVCINNLRQIDGSKQQWALEFKKVGYEIAQSSDIEPYLVRGTSGRMPVCPAGGSTATNFDSSYSINALSNPPTCLVVSNTHQLP